MESTQRRCPEKGCERHPQPGWTRCEQHSEEWLTRVFRSAVPDRPEELPRYVGHDHDPGSDQCMTCGSYATPKIDELELRALAGDQ